MEKKLTITGIFNDIFTNYEDKESSVSMTVDDELDCTCGEKRCLIHEMPANYILSNVQSELFPLPDAKPLLVDGLTCNSCEHRQRHECNSKVFQYCGVRKSNRTANGLLKIKCKTDACPLYQRCTITNQH